ncbi:MAG TPA: copper resistance protein CopC [Ktedonobacteraceae bacterium]
MRFFHRSSHRRLQLVCTLVLTLGLLFIMTGTALAHASVIDSNPKMNSTITLATLPTTITVTTAENMKPGPSNSDLFVYGPSGKLISQGDATVALNDPTHMSVAIKPDKTGVYTVHWKTVSADDGDPDEGAFGFTVTSTLSSPSIEAKTAPNSDMAGTPIWVSIVAGVIALLVGLGVGIGIGRAGKSQPSLPEETVANN